MAAPYMNRRPRRQLRNTPKYVYDPLHRLVELKLFDAHQSIRRHGNGWRWSDRAGNSVSYDSAGRISGYANRNGVGVSFVRDWRFRLM